MSVQQIITTGQTSKFSDVFVVQKGHVVVISSFNFACAQTDDVGNETKAADCAVLHKLEINGDNIPHVKDGCGCVLTNLGFHISRSEPVIQCGELWTHNANTNLTVLSVPGYYMFELCNESAVGTATMQVEDLSIADAMLLPRDIFHGEC